MTRNSEPLRIANIVSAAVALIILVLAFTLPRAFLNALKSDITALTESCEAAAHNEDFESARTDAEGMERIFRKSHNKMRLCLNHEDIDELELAIESCVQLAAIGDGPELLISLEKTENIVTYIAAIESFSIYDLL